MPAAAVNEGAAGVVPELLGKCDNVTGLISQVIRGAHSQPRHPPRAQWEAWRQEKFNLAGRLRLRTEEDCAVAAHSPSVLAGVARRGLAYALRTSPHRQRARRGALVLAWPQ